MVTKLDQIKFYTEELKELEFSVKANFNATGYSLFQNGKVYVGQFKGIDEKRGNVFIDIPCGEKYNSPRLDQKLNCFTLKSGMAKPSSWNNLSYADLLKDRNRTETVIVDYIPSKKDGWITMLMRNMDAKFVELLQHNQILAFGPTIPPFEYLMNLQQFSKSFDDDEESVWSNILSFKYPLNNGRNPVLLTEETDIPQSIIDELEHSNLYVFQGPPGTGKTHQIADLVSRLVYNNNSVLLAALTNKATIEVCEKPFFEKIFEEQRISKLPLSMDEKLKFPKLMDAKELIPSKGHVILTTYYQFSKIWQTQSQTFDYVIIEEASQSYLTTIAAACKIGKKVVIVGDPKQIVPIVTNKNYQIIPNVEQLINGMSTTSLIEKFEFRRKVETRRLTQRSTDYTNCFYENTIQSKSLYNEIDEDLKQLPVISNLMHANGGPSLLLFSNKSGRMLKEVENFLVIAVDELSLLKNNSIAILTPYVDTLTILQQSLKSKTKVKNYLIETVDRVQGLDVDYCFYIIPKSTSFSFNINRFNVATSRAKKCTFIVVEEDFDKKINLSAEVGVFLDKLKNSMSFVYPFEKNINTASNILTDNGVHSSFGATEIENLANDKIFTNLGLKVLGKIDVSQFERKKKEINKEKQNFYVIDTNVFVDYPDIIQKIENQYPILLSAKVIDELDYLKISLSEDQKGNVRKALKNINASLNSRDIRMEMADVSLLPLDFNRKSPDNMILSVLLKYKKDNPILLTSDNGLQIKAKGLNFMTIGLKEFLKK